MKKHSWPNGIRIAAATMPWITVHLCWLISLQAGLIAECNPYLEGCTSISATGRHGLSWWLFKAGILPTALVYLLVWRAAGDWLTAAGLRARPVLICGVIGAVFLVLYTVFLGSEGELYTWLRRLGARMFFAFTALAQLLFTWQAMRLRPRPAWAAWMLSLCTFQLCIGVASLPAAALMSDPDPVQNIVEWWYALALNLWFLALSRAANVAQSGAAQRR